MRNKNEKIQNQTIYINFTYNCKAWFIINKENSKEIVDGSCTSK